MAAMTASDRAVTGAKLWAWREKALAEAQAAGVDADEVDWLLMAVADVERLLLRLGTVQQRSHITLRYSLTELESRWQQRLMQRTPVQYLVGETPWRDLMLTVS